jgi:hypothetical protein
MVHGLAVHGVEHFGGDVCGAGGVQEAVAGDAAWAIAVHSNRVFVLEERQFSMGRGRALCAMDARMAWISRSSPALPLARISVFMRAF